MMRRAALMLTLTLAATAPCLAQTDFPKEGQVYQSFAVDLNHDHQPERVGLRAYFVSDMEYWGQLMVWNSQGNVLWQGPKAPTAQSYRIANPLALFGGWNSGVVEMDGLGDLDGDGQIEMLSGAPQSDVRPPTFRMFRWQGKAFGYVDDRQLLEQPIGSGQFVWRKPGSWNGAEASWVMRFVSPEKGWIATVFQTTKGNTKVGTAKMEPTRQGFKLLAWLKKPS